MRNVHRNGMHRAGTDTGAASGAPFGHHRSLRSPTQQWTERYCIAFAYILADTAGDPAQFDAAFVDGGLKTPRCANLQRLKAVALADLPALAAKRTLPLHEIDDGVAGVTWHDHIRPAGNNAVATAGAAIRKLLFTPAPGGAQLLSATAKAAEQGAA